ncbi:MAG: SulP family inorganic anion transporter [Rhodocyclaceae bacterium]
MKASIKKFLPFLEWLPFSGSQMRADLIAGVTVALVLVPQSMAYAQLAGLPVVYGLYAGFVPVIIAALWGSLRQLHTGPVAMLSLMSAAALLPFAAPGSPKFIQLSLMLAMMVGVLRLVMGLFRLGLVINFLSHPVIIGFTNAAALIIGLSQLNKLINVPMPRSDSFVTDLWAVLRQLGETHLPTLLFALGAFLIIYVMQKRAPRLPAILFAILFAIPLSAGLGFERLQTVTPERIRDAAYLEKIQVFKQTQELARQEGLALASAQARLTEAQDRGQAALREQIESRAQVDLAELELNRLRAEIARLRAGLFSIPLVVENTSDGEAFFRVAREDERGILAFNLWRFQGKQGNEIKLSNGGEVVGAIPAGVPTPSMPEFDWDTAIALLPAALVMALLGFMEATSITQAIVAKTKQRVDINRELVGQGLANIVGSFFHAFVVSGSFSRSALAARVGAQSGLFAVISAFGVLIVMLFLTPLLYHLPQAVLAVIIMFAVFSLIRVRSLIEAWHVNRVDATIGWLTFFATLSLAPALADGILLGVGLTILVYLLRSMRPRAEILGRHADGSLGGVDSHGLQPLGREYVALRFDGSLNFVNVAFFEEAVLDTLRRFPHMRALLIVGSGINDIDVSGQEKVRALAQRLAESGVNLYFSSLKRQVREVFEQAPLIDAIPSANQFKTKEQAVATLAARYDQKAPQ